jgi:hypothetical protein
MRSRCYVAAVAATVLLSIGGVDAATGLLPQGRRCGFGSTAGPAENEQTGAVQVGPLVVFDGPAVVHCALYVNGVLATAIETRTAGAGAVEVAAGAAPLRYRASVLDDVVMCTIVRYDSGATIWYHPTSSWNPFSGVWTSAPLAPYACGRIQNLYPYRAECSVLRTVDQQVGTQVAEDEFWACDPLDEPVDPYQPII